MDRLGDKMNRYNRFLFTAAAAFAAFSAPLALAQDEDGREVRLGPIVVTPTRAEAAVGTTPGTVTVITREEIERRQYRSLNDALRDVPGLRVVASGGVGSQTSVFMRGMNSNHVLVLQDGRQLIADPSTPNGAFNFAHLSLENVERVEVLRGPLASLYGSQAMGGVINIITRKGERDPKFTLQSELGTLQTTDTVANANGRVDSFGFDITGRYFWTEGDDITAKRYRPAGSSREDDSYERISGSAKFDVELTDTMDFTIFGEVIDTEKELDTNPNDPNSEEFTTTYNSYAALNGLFLDGRYRPNLKLGYSRSERDDKDNQDAFSTTIVRTERVGEIYSVLSDHQYDLDEHHTVTLGGEYYHETLDSNGFSNFGGFIITNLTEKSQDRGSVFLQDTMTYGDFTMVVGGRLDIVEDFSDQATWNVSPSYFIAETGTTLRGSIGTGFKIPSLYERFGFQPTNFGNAFRGNPNLKAEESFGFEIGFEQSLFDDRVTFGATYFHSDVENSIVTIFLPGFNSTTVGNQDLDIDGVETFVSLEPVDWANLNFSYTYTDARNTTTDLRALRRPRHKLSADGTVYFEDRGSLTLGVIHIGNVVDADYVTGTPTKLDSYTVVRVAGSYEVMDGVELLGRVENLLDEDYERAHGFQAPGFEAFAGFRVTLP